jgi:hypothetical protein
MTQGAVRASFNWAQYGRGDADAEASAKAEATELARALALQTIAFSKDAVVEEYADRLSAIGDTIWPSAPLAGYGLHSSLGAFAVTKVAVGWAPSLGTGLRHEPHERQGLIEALQEQGVDATFALAVVGDWKRVERGFTADQSGLESSRIAGLVEGSLSRHERARALSQVAYSGRDLARLASSISVLSSVRTVMPLLPPEELGEDFAAAMTALVLRRPERALQLIGDRPRGIGVRTLAELAHALICLDRGASPDFEDEGLVLAPPCGDRSEVDADDEETYVPKPNGDTDDVLEIIEERVDHQREATEHTKPRLPSPARWWASPEDAPADVEDRDLDAWAKRLDESSGLLAKRGSLLGLKPFPLPRGLLPIRLAPDERLVKASDLAAEALFPPARGFLRAIFSSAEGRGPTESALKHAGDLAYLLRRARALAAIVHGDLEGAREDVKTLPPEVSPEGQWAADRLARFGGRRAVRATEHEAMGFAAMLVADLVQQLGRSVAGTIGRGAPTSGERPS